MISLSDFVLPKQIKWITLAVLLGVIVATGLHLVGRYYQSQITEKEKEAKELRQQARDLMTYASTLKSQADQMKTDLAKANEKLVKLRAAVDQIHVPPGPGPTPAKKQIISDLQKNGYELVLKPSSMIAPSAFGVTENDAQLMWQNSMQALRVPALEAKIGAQQNLILGLEDAKKQTENYAETRSKQADVAMQAADKAQREADISRSIAEDAKKALKNERRKKILYAAGGVLAGYLVEREIIHAH